MSAHDRPLPRRLGVALCAVACAMAACGRSTADPPGDRARTTESGTASHVARAPAPVARPRVVALGDSLTAGLGLQPDEAYPALLQQKITSAGLDFEVVNAGVSGDTSAGGLRRLDWALAGDVRVLILALGANDGLRGLQVSELKKNLAAIIEQAQARGIAVLLAGMEAPPNFGRAYVVEFHQVYPDLAREYGLPHVPFLLEGVAGISTLNQRDGIHPTGEGARLIADNVWTVLEPILEKTSPRGRGEGVPGS
jgi:acyl-CoA thioesterase-1